MGVAPKPEQREEEGDVDDGCGEGGGGGGKGASEAAEGESKFHELAKWSRGKRGRSKEGGKSERGVRRGWDGGQAQERHEGGMGGCTREWEIGSGRGAGRRERGPMNSPGFGIVVPWACKVEAREVREREGTSAEHKREVREHEGGCGRVCESGRGRGRGRGRGSGRWRGQETGEGEGERERDADQDGSDNDGGGDVEAGERVREEVREEEGHGLKGVGKGVQGGTMPREGKRVGVGGRGRESGEGKDTAIIGSKEGSDIDGGETRHQGGERERDRDKKRLRETERRPSECECETETKTKTKTKRAQGWNVEWLKREGSNINGGLRNGGAKGRGIERGEESCRTDSKHLGDEQLTTNVTNEYIKPAEESSLYHLSLTSAGVAEGCAGRWRNVGAVKMFEAKRPPSCSGGEWNGKERAGRRNIGKRKKMGDKTTASVGGTTRMLEQANRWETKRLQVWMERQGHRNSCNWWNGEREWEGGMSEQRKGGKRNDHQLVGDKTTAKCGWNKENVGTKQ
ncbi:hypothetical protein V8E53_008878 [Lactarius tabidus]